MPPAAALSEGRVEHPARQRPDQPGLLGDRHEQVWTEQPVPRMLPAHERLGAGDAAGRQADLGLEVQRQLVLVDGTPQLAHHCQAHRAVLVLVGRIHRVAHVAALGDVHRHVSAAEERIGVMAVVRRQRDANAGVDLELQTAEGKRLLQDLQQAIGDLLGLVECRRWQQDGELVAAEARDGV